MAIYIHKNDIQHEYQPGDFILYHTDWNDWWTYENLYTLKYVRTDTTTKLIGQVKIGQLDNNESRVPDLPNSFSQLASDRFISLGQDPTYYDSLNRLGLHVKERFLTALNDIAFSTGLLHQHRQRDVVKRSLMRDIPFSTVENQFNRIARGGAILTPYHFEYHYPQDDIHSDDNLVLDFSVQPESNPPSNIHVLIGRNGVGKTWLEECTLVLLDEPELHLHPPLLAAFTRALSQLLINRNGVAIIATHASHFLL